MGANPSSKIIWRDAIAVEWARLESVCALIAYRGFESLSLRHYLVLVIPIKFFADSSSVVYEMRAVGWKIVRNDFGL